MSYCADCFRPCDSSWHSFSHAKEILVEVPLTSFFDGLELIRLIEVENTESLRMNFEGNSWQYWIRFDTSVRCHLVSTNFVSAWSKATCEGNHDKNNQKNNEQKSGKKPRDNNFRCGNVMWSKTLCLWIINETLWYWNYQTMDFMSVEEICS